MQFLHLEHMDSSNLFSSNWPPIHLSACNSSTQSAVNELSLGLNIPIPAIYEYGDYVAIKIMVSVSIPFRGTVDGIDIRPQEPLLILFHKTNFPGRSPQVRSDRRDFPAGNLPHLNPVWPGEPYSLCLYRGNIDDWYSEHSIIELIERAKIWLSDAAMGHLIKEKDRFEATRIDGFNLFGGVSIFNHKRFSDYIEKAWDKDSSGGMAYVASYGSTTSDKFEVIRLFSDYIAFQLKGILQRYKSVREMNPAVQRGVELPGILLWSSKDHVYKKYFGHLPKTVSELYELSNELGLNLRDPLLSLLTFGKKDGKNIFPIFFCVQRPLNLINLESRLEILSLLLSTKEDRVYALPSREPLTSQFAQKLSDAKLQKSKRIFLLGCGALGSKIGLHLGRAGITDLTIVDSDTLSPHNLVRHALFPNSVGENKALGLEKVIRRMYLDGEQELNISSTSRNIFSLLNTGTNLFKGAKLIVDATASTAVFRRLVSHTDLYKVPIIRCEIANYGKLGVMLIEGAGRNPNLGDLRASLYDAALENYPVEKWLSGFKELNDDEIGFGLEEITIGLGCSSPTMKISDDLVSFHASTQSLTIRMLLSERRHTSGVYITNLSDTNHLQVFSSFIPVEKYLTLKAGQSKNWTIRIRDGIQKILLQRTSEHSPNETGGILIGHIDYSQKTIYITRHLDPPKDSIEWPYAFRLGINNIPELVREIKQRTGNLISYVGEWHSHPTGSSELSDTDHKAINQLKKNLGKIGMPTLVMVVTPSGCYPYIS